MSAIATKSEMPPLVVRTRPVFDMTNDEFYAFCRLNPELHIERNAQGEIAIMPPAGGETGNRNAALTAHLFFWSRKDGQGVAFDSSTGFVLPNGATRSPDAAWVRLDRLEQLTPDEKEKFLPLAPDFVIELRSPTDALQTIQAKMEEYRENGVLLGWLIDPLERQVIVYRPKMAVEHLYDPATLSAEPELPGLHLDLGEIWTPSF